MGYKSVGCRYLSLGGWCAHKSVDGRRTCAEVLSAFACPACCCGEPCDSIGDADECKTCRVQCEGAWKHVRKGKA